MAQAKVFFEVFLFMDGMTIYTLDNLGNANTEQVIVFKKSKKTIKEIKKKIKEIKNLNGNYTIFVRHHPNLEISNLRKL